MTVDYEPILVTFKFAMPSRIRLALDADSDVLSDKTSDISNWSLGASDYYFLRSFPEYPPSNFFQFLREAPYGCKVDSREQTNPT
jgi:hypothetical protein